jgi:hypothetical protein
LHASLLGAFALELIAVIQSGHGEPCVCT